MLLFCMVVHTEPQSDATHSRRTVSPSARDLCGLSVSALDCSYSVFSGRFDLSPLKCALADKRRVLPVFSRNRQPSSPLEATLMSILVGVDSKRFIVETKSFRCNIYKKHGGGATFKPKALSLSSPCSLHSAHCRGQPLVPQSPKARDFFTIRETTPLLPVSKNTKADFASRAWVQRFKAGFRVCT